MSSHFKLRCELHEADGPGIRLTARHVGLYGNDFCAQPDTTQQDWQTFLKEHEFCGEMILIRDE